MPTVIYTDHSATVAIATSNSLKSVAVEKLNLRLVRASQFIQFQDRKKQTPKMDLVPSSALRQVSGLPDIVESLITYHTNAYVDLNAVKPCLRLYIPPRL